MDRVVIIHSTGSDIDYPDSKELMKKFYDPQGYNFIDFVDNNDG